MNFKKSTYWSVIMILLLLAAPALAADAPKVDSGDTAWVLASSALVMIMTPALGLFYGGMVRKKNALSTIMFSFAILASSSVLAIRISPYFMMDSPASLSIPMAASW